MKSSNKNKDWVVKAYDNSEFLHSPSARPIRILSEMLEPAHRLRKNNIKNTIVFFGSARTLPRATAKKNIKTIEKQIGRSSSRRLKQKLEDAKNDLCMAQYYEDTVDLSYKLNKWFKQLKSKGKHFTVCTGGGPGIMEAANRGAQKAGEKSIGLNISLPMEQYPNPYQSKDVSFEFHYFFIRKFWFFYLAKALIVFPGGFGTLDEFFELLTLIQTRKSKKHMPVILYGMDYWSKIVNFDEMAKWGMISREDLKLFKTCSTVDDAFKIIKQELLKHHI